LGEDGVFVYARAAPTFRHSSESWNPFAFDFRASARRQKTSAHVRTFENHPHPTLSLKERAKAKANTQKKAAVPKDGGATLQKPMKLTGKPRP
jgi:hypothetical protein